MVLERRVRIKRYFLPSRGKRYERWLLIIPPDIARDSQFPFKPDEEVIVRIDPEFKRLIIEKVMP